MTQPQGGDRLYVETFTETLRQIYVKQTSEGRSTANTGATMTADGELQGIELDEGTWEIVVDGGFVSPAGIDAKTQWSFTGTWNNPLRYCDGPTSANNIAGSLAFDRQHSAYATNNNCVYGLAASAAYTGFYERSRQVVVTVAGLMSFSWAQNAASASDLFCTQGTTVTARKISD